MTYIKNKFILSINLFCGVIYMMITIQKWGNSQGIRIPKTILDEVNWSVSDNIELTTENNTIILKQHKKLTFDELFKDYNEKIQCKEFDWGESVGAEKW